MIIAINLALILQVNPFGLVPAMVDGDTILVSPTRRILFKSVRAHAIP